MTNQPQQALPPELQARIDQIIAQAQLPTNGVQAPQAQPEPQVTTPARPPSLMDHVIALRQEVHALSSQVQAMAQVTQAVGGAVGELYQMFQAETTTTNYSTNFQEARPSQLDDNDY